MLGDLLRSLLPGQDKGRLKNPILTPPPKPSQSNEEPSWRQLNAANSRYRDVPSVNLDGSVNNLPPGTSAFQKLTPPLIRPSGVHYFDPLDSKIKRREGYRIMPINPDSAPKPMSYMELMKAR